MRIMSALGCALVALIAAAPATAQESAPASAQFHVGASAGYEDLTVDAPGSDGGAIFGGVVGVDVPVSDNLVAGVEGNFHVGTSAIDYDYGIAARIGYRFPSGGIAYVRGGYQWVNLDISKLAGADIDDDAIGISDTVDDYLVGVGGEFPLSNTRLRLRVGIDTISFDSVRPNAALILGF